MLVQIAGWILSAGAVILPLAADTRLPDHYASAKWLMLYGAAILSMSSMFLSGAKWLVPRGRFGFGLLIGGGAYFLSMILGLPGPFDGPALDAICFICIVLVSYNLVLLRFPLVERLIACSWVAGCVVSVYVLVQKLGYEPFPDLVHSAIPSATFGFQNMTAEFLGIAFVLSLSGNFRQRDFGPYAKVIWVSGMVLGLVALVITNSRAGFLSLAAAVVCYVLLGRHSIAAKINRRWVYFFGGVCLAAVAVVSFRGLDASEASKKDWNSQVRLIRWMNTLELIRANSLTGLGPGQYEFGYVPYSRSIGKDPEASEHQVVRSPHNGYLELLSECGLPLGVAMLIGLAWFLRAIYFEARKSEDLRCLFALFIFLAVDALFAFPMENPYPFFIAGLALGTACARLGADGCLVPPKLVLALIPAVLFGATYLAGWFLQSSLTQTVFRDRPELVESACANFPSHWRNCIQDAYHKLYSGDAEGALATSQRLLELQPANFVALRVKAENELKLGRKDEACKSLSLYDSWFVGTSSLQAVLSQNCR